MDANPPERPDMPWGQISVRLINMRQRKHTEQIYNVDPKPGENQTSEAKEQRLELARRKINK